MCGITAFLDIQHCEPVALRDEAVRAARLIRHRGPDWSGVFVASDAILCHERLAIVAVSCGSQPISSADGQLSLIVNGEIYNHVDVSAGLRVPYEFQTKSDCEVISALYCQAKAENSPMEAWIDQLRGMYAFVLHDEVRKDFVVARDHLGIIPLYYGHDDHGVLRVASEMKCIEASCRDAKVFPPGHFMQKGDIEPRRWYARDWMTYESVKDNVTDKLELRQAFVDAVRCHMMSDVPYGVLLSGGLDSSLVAAVAQRFKQRRVEAGGKTEAWWPQLHSFAVGLKDSPDLAAARKMAEHIESIHHEILINVQDGLDAIRDVIYHVETYDVTTIRASTPMFLLARYIKAHGVKMVLSGEGSDEIFGGYLYFHKAPNAQELHEECVRKLDALHLFDLARANKSLAAWGVEARVPFLDKKFLDAAMRIAPQDKLCPGTMIEKKVLRECFTDLLPAEVAWRQKEQFSDGVGYSWIDSLKEVAAAKVTDAQLAAAIHRFPINPPATKEAYFYRQIFEEHFPSSAAASSIMGGPSVACSSPTAIAWDKAFQEAARQDPSGRAVDVHSSAY